MPNLPAAHDALEIGHQLPALDLGLHLTLTVGPPISTPDSVPSLVGEHGHFQSLPRLLARLTSRRISRDELRRELEAQIEWAGRHGLRASHLDSHHHVHLHPEISELVLELASQIGAPFVRCPTEGVLPGTRVGAPPRDLLRSAVITAAAQLSRGRIQDQGFTIADHFRGISIGFGFSGKLLSRTLATLPAGLTELMTHPGYADPELAQWDWLGGPRERELRVLTTPRLRHTIDRLGIRLTTFREVAAVRSYT